MADGNIAVRVQRCSTSAAEDPLKGPVDMKGERKCVWRIANSYLALI